MIRSKLRNRYIKLKTTEMHDAYKKTETLCITSEKNQEDFL